LKRILLVIGYLHSLDIVHRDIKPNNVVLCSKDELADIKLIDFGLSAKYSGKNFRSIVGTPVFVAPEIFKKTYGKECDI